VFFFRSEVYQSLAVDQNVVKTYTLLLKKYIDTEDKELQAMFALQRLYMEVEQPPSKI